MPSTPNPSDSDTQHCPTCGAVVPPDANYCSHCGTALGEPTLPTYCSACGAPFDHDDEFCTNCGTARIDPADRSSQPSGPGLDSSSTQPPGSGPDSSPSQPSGSGPDSSPSQPSGSGPDSSPSQPSGSGPDTRSTRASSTDHDSDAYRTFRRRVQRHLGAGWEIQHDYGDRVVLVDRDIGSIAVHVVLLLFTGGLGNLLYGWYHYSELAETRHLSVDDPSPDSAPAADRTPTKRPDTESTGDGPLVTASAYVLSAFMVLIAFGLLAAGITSGSIILATIGFVLAGGGFYVAPAVHRRIDRRHELTAFGRRRTVDHRLISPSERCDEPCVVCGEGFDGGLVRRRRDETVVAGVPVRTHSIRHNHYCADCARAELLGPSIDLETTDTDDPDRKADVIADGVRGDDPAPTHESESTETQAPASTDGMSEQRE